MYVTAKDTIHFKLPAEPGPMRVARLEPLQYDKLIDPSFRRLLAAFESVGTATSVAYVGAGRGGATPISEAY